MSFHKKETEKTELVARPDPQLDFKSIALPVCDCVPKDALWVEAFCRPPGRPGVLEVNPDGDGEAGFDCRDGPDHWDVDFAPASFVSARNSL